MSFKKAIGEFHAWLVEENERIDRVLHAGETPRRGMPVTFYAWPLFSKRGGGATQVGNVMLVPTVPLGEKDLSLVEEVGAGIFGRDETGRLLSTVNGDLQKLLSRVDGLLASRWTWRGHLIEKRTLFSLVDRVESSGNERCTVTLSREFSLFWHIDNLIPPLPALEVISLLENTISRALIRSSFAAFGDYPVNAEKLLRSIGYEVSAVSQEFYEVAQELIARKDTLAEAGLKYRDRAIVFDKSRQPLDFVPLPGDYFSLIRNRQKYEEALALFAKEEKVEVRVREEKPAPRRRERRKKGPEVVIVEGADGMKFEAKTIREAEGFLETAQRIFEPWVGEEALAEVFDEFRYHWREVKPVRKKSWRRTWSDWLRRANTGYSVEFFPVEEAIQAAEKVGMSHSEAVTEHRRFVNYYLSAGQLRKKWLPAWESWIERASENRVQKQKSAAFKTRVDYAYYLSKLVSEAIQDKIKAQGVRVEDVIAGHVEVQGVGYKSVPVPPLGKDRETLFFYLDPAKQEAAKRAFMGVDPLEGGEAEPDYIDTKIVE